MSKRVFDSDLIFDLDNSQEEIEKTEDEQTEDESESVNAKRLKYFANFDSKSQSNSSSSSSSSNSNSSNSNNSNSNNSNNSNNSSHSKVYKSVSAPNVTVSPTKPSNIVRSSSTNLYVKKSDSVVVIDLDDDDTEPESEPKFNIKQQNNNNYNNNSSSSSNINSNSNSSKHITLNSSFEFDFDDDTDKETDSHPNQYQSRNTINTNNDSKNKSKQSSNNLGVTEDEEDQILQEVLKRSLVETKMNNKGGSNSDSPKQQNGYRNNNNTTTTTTTSSSSSSNSPKSNTSISGSSSVNNSGEIFYLNQLPTNHSSNFINIFNIFGKPGMKSALVSGFALDWKWIRSQIKICQNNEVPITFIKDYNLKDEKPGRFQSPEHEDILFINPPMNNGGFGCQHSKLMLLVYDDSIRVVIPSANPTRFDYDDIGQTIWFQDFPKVNSQPPPSQFQDTLKLFIKSCALPNTFLDKYDFSIAKVHLIVSIPGYHRGASMNQCGHMQLRSILKKYYTDKENDLKHSDFPIIIKKREVHSQTSSLGLVNDKWSPQFLESTQTLTKSKLVDPTGLLHILFPKNLILHSKIITGTTKFEHNDKLRFDWVYVGSHNLSPAAWGRLQKDNSQLYISNFEIGVLLLNEKPYDDLTPPKWHQNIPFEIPAAPYKDSDRPFMQDKL
ncbi:protein-tyrosine phosphatase 3 [Heterostelium album PN500]|uniref:Protein-tyrosine phosphatase 3 n=1 Tax=Heterostelium pallidum (strain ATCC 26659 / Pp 5 / PN500) TaxID=670386 RepID=D3BT02_HETP5|nr:protein-tyrosine phosphatase 3 [Heterostelium album PN500]EFA75617.1 protein-tyrosine phosphatase 3 [Heterostelium album PN500]|eukprot:XP_020427751.1 protein-tyrosine phosphatase 3 [Heterostelium album PN500]